MYAASLLFFVLRTLRARHFKNWVAARAAPMICFRKNDNMYMSIVIMVAITVDNWKIDIRFLHII